MLSWRSTLIAGAALGVLLTSIGHAQLRPEPKQSYAYALNGDSKSYGFGWSVSGAGDVNRDGFDDVIVGMPNYEPPSARVFSGKDGALIRTHTSLNPAHVSSFFGGAVAGLGDINHDGYDDVGVGAIGEHHPNGDAKTGAVYVFSGKDGDLLHRVHGLSTHENLGRAVGAAGDINADGYLDVIATGTGPDEPADRPGSAYLISGKDGTILYIITGDLVGDRFGSAADGVGDLDGDGHDDFVVGAWLVGLDDDGMARVFSGRTGGELYSVYGQWWHTWVGLTVAGLHGDVSGDGVPDILVGSGYAALVVSGADGMVLEELESEDCCDSFGRVGAAGDVDGDDVIDFAVGAHSVGTNQSPGHVYVYSGANFELITRFSGLQTYDHFGVALDGAGDTNGDGFADLIVGSPRNDTASNNAGAAFVFTRICRSPQAYCTAKASPLGCVPAIGSWGQPSVSEEAGFVVVGEGVRNNTNGLLFYGFQGATQFPFQGGVLCIEPPVYRTNAVTSHGTPAPIRNCTGIFAIDMNSFAANSGLPAFQQPFQTVNVQWWGRDAQDPFGSQLSNALEYQLCP